MPIVEIICEKCGVRFMHISPHKYSGRKKFCDSCLYKRQKLQEKNKYNKSEFKMEVK